MPAILKLDTKALIKLHLLDADALHTNVIPCH
jgi:hypothetical protein